MILQMCTVHDTATEMFGRPFFMVATGQAVRSFRDEVNNPDSEFSKHPDDYSLYHLGQYDDNTGGFELFGRPTLLVRGKDMFVPKGE